MASHSFDLQIQTQGFCDLHDLTSAVEGFLEQSGCSEGLAAVFVPGATAGITTIEYESGAIEDFRRAIERIAPEDGVYAHNERWGDGNGFSHVRAALLGPSLAVPIRGGALQLGTWQQIVLVDFDNRPRTRRVAVQILGL